MEIDNFKKFQREKIIEKIVVKEIWDYTKVGSKLQLVNNSLEEQRSEIVQFAIKTDIHSKIYLEELGEKSIMLVYPDQGHVLTDPASQKDLTIRTLEWFNYYLKDDHSYLWITSGTK